MRTGEAMSAASTFDRAAGDADILARQRAAEPSMEEILASIRRIIADDDALPLAPRTAQRLVEPPFAPAAPVLTLVAPAHVAPAFVAPAFVVPAPEPAPVDEEHEYIAQAPEVWQHHAPMPHPAEPYPYAPAPLVSSDTHVAVQASFDSLAATVMAQNSAMIEENIRTMLRPLLKSWLDDNLPVIVEKLVRTEIERVARGGR